VISWPYLQSRVIIFAFGVNKCDLRKDGIWFSGVRIGNYVDSEMSIKE